MFSSGSKHISDPRRDYRTSMDHAQPSTDQLRLLFPSMLNCAILLLRSCFIFCVDTEGTLSLHE